MRNRILKVGHAFWQLAFFGVPLLLLLIVSFWTFNGYRLTPTATLANYRSLLQQQAFSQALATSIAMGLVSGLLTVLISAPASLAMFFWVRREINAVLLFLFLLPFLSSFTVRTFSWYSWLSDSGILGTLLHKLGWGSIHLLNTPYAVLIGELSVLAPVGCLLGYSAVSRVDRATIEAAYNLGASFSQVLCYIIWPYLYGGVAVSFGYSFLFTVADYITPSILGGNQRYTLAVFIQDRLKIDDWPSAAASSVILLALLFVLGLVAFGVSRVRVLREPR
jgi:ABC-type spermidine/putrescine transport system permease subunit I